MPQKSIELVLLRQFSDYLNNPVLIIDATGILVYYNEASEKILGIHFADTGELAREDWSAILLACDANGQLLSDHLLPLHVALNTQQPVNEIFYLQTPYAIRHVNCYALPIIDNQHNLAGVVGFLWGVLT